MNKEVFTLNSLRKLRKDKGLSQQGLAELLDVNQTAISQWERGITSPSSRMLLKLSQIFNINPRELLNNEVISPTQWDDPELVQAVSDNLSALFDTVEQAVRGLSDEEQKLVFDVLVELRHTLKLKDSAQRREALRLLHDTAPAVLHWPEKNRSDAAAQE